MSAPGNVYSSKSSGISKVTWAPCFLSSGCILCTIIPKYSLTLKVCWISSTWSTDTFLNPSIKVEALPRFIDIILLLSFNFSIKSSNWARPSLSWVYASSIFLTILSKKVDNVNVTPIGVFISWATPATNWLVNTRFALYISSSSVASNVWSVRSNLSFLTINSDWVSWIVDKDVSNSRLRAFSSPVRISTFSSSSLFKVSSSPVKLFVSSSEISKACLIWLKLFTSPAISSLDVTSISPICLLSTTPSNRSARLLIGLVIRLDKM